MRAVRAQSTVGAVVVARTVAVVTCLILFQKYTRTLAECEKSKTNQKDSKDLKNVTTLVTHVMNAIA